MERFGKRTVEAMRVRESHHSCTPIILISKQLLVGKSISELSYSGPSQLSICPCFPAVWSFARSATSLSS